MIKKNTKILAVDEQNAAVLVQLITGSNITDKLRIDAMNKLIGSKEGGETFFRTLFEEKLSYGSCPNCGHENHWLMTEDESNVMGWVSHEEDERVPETTDAENCPLYQQSCLKKKITT